MISEPRHVLTTTNCRLRYLQESKYKQSNAQLENLKVEYQQYKQRASTLLQQQREAVHADDDSKLKDLQNQLEALTKENRSALAVIFIRGVRKQSVALLIFNYPTIQIDN